MVQWLIAKPISGSSQLEEESYEIRWTISNWLQVRKSGSLVNGQVAVFETGSSPSAWFKTKWLVGLKISNDDDDSWIRIYWKLLDITGSQTMKLDVELQTNLWNFGANMFHYPTDNVSREVKLMEIVEGTKQQLRFQRNNEPFHLERNLINDSGQILYILKLTMKTPTMKTADYNCFKMKQFSKLSADQQRQNQAALLNDTETADLKFLTSDEVEIWAHKAILKAQCPVFAAMLNCDLSENATGIVRMTDITGKTMKLLLHYFYTGELLPTWCDRDTIVEFTYAAGKYQMTKVLVLLDDFLGMNSEDASILDVQLINLAGKLKLEKAETRLLERIVSKIQDVKRSEEIFMLFRYEEDELLEVAEMLANEKVGELKILTTMDDLYGYGTGTDESEICLSNGMIMLALVQKKGLRKLEKNLLKCFAEKAELVQNADQLFNLFGRGKQMEK